MKQNKRLSTNIRFHIHKVSFMLKASVMSLAGVNDEANIIWLYFIISSVSKIVVAIVTVSNKSYKDNNITAM